jgi:hypothetical protein
MHCSNRNEYTDNSQKIEKASASYIKIEEKAMKAEADAKVARMAATAAKKVHSKLHKDLEDLIGRCSKE